MAIDPRTAAARARAEARWDRLTIHYGKRGIGYLDGVWFAARCDHSLRFLEDRVLQQESESRLTDISWPVMALDAVGPMIEPPKMRPWLFLQIRGKYLTWAVRADGGVVVHADPLLAACLEDIGIRLVRPMRDRDEVAKLRLWA